MCIEKHENYVENFFMRKINEKMCHVIFHTSFVLFYTYFVQLEDYAHATDVWGRTVDILCIQTTVQISTCFTHRAEVLQWYVNSVHTVIINCKECLGTSLWD